MKKYLQKPNPLIYLVLTGILILAAFLRLYKVNSIPSGFFWDEAGIAYNALSISNWYRDEFGSFLPLSFRSFGDFKAPLFIYFMAGIFKIVGFHLELLRITTALIGVVNVLFLFLLAKKFFGKFKHVWWMSLTSAFILSVTPWSIHFSRIGVESQLALMLVMGGIYFGLVGLKLNNYWFVSAILFGLSVYAYHSLKIFLPILVILTLVSFWNEFRKIWKTLIAPVLVFLVLSIPMVYDTLFQNGFERGKNLIFYTNDEIRPLGEISLRLVNNLKGYFGYKFWLFGEDAIGLRHGPKGSGFIFFSILLMFISGLVKAIKSRSSETMFLLIWLIAGMTPAILTNDSPHVIRSMLALPPIILLSVLGLETISRYLSKKIHLAEKVIYVLFIVVVSIELIFYFQTYILDYATKSASEFQFGHKQVVEAINDISQGNMRVEMTNRYGQPQIYVLLFNQILPRDYINGELSLYKFYDLRGIDFEPGILYVGTPEELSGRNELEILDEIKFPDGTTAFIIARMKSDE